MDKKIFIALGLSLLTVWGFNYYTTRSLHQAAQPGGPIAVGQQPAAVAGQPIKVPTTQELYKPLKLDIEFTDQKLTTQETIIDIQTPYVKASMSTYGAILTSLDFVKYSGKNKTPLRTVYNKGTIDLDARKKGCFLVALDQKTPYVYTYGGKIDDGKIIHVLFKTETDQWFITKTYQFHKDGYQLDMLLSFDPKKPQSLPIHPRILFASPFVNKIADDTTTLLSWNESKETIDKTEIASSTGIAWPWTGQKILVGAEDRYFVHALINDPVHFVQRSYIKQWDGKNASPVLEGPEISTKRECKLSFYMGPKVFDHLNAADNRLEELLSFGWLSWICKLLLKLLAWIYSFIGNFGFAIIVMTIILKLPFTPLSIYSRKQMETYQHYLPSINKIRTKYRQDMQMQHQELMKFYHDHNIAPTTHMVGCLPLLIQMPILFALYRVLNNYVDLYQAPFFGWITDLSSRDPYFILPVLMGLSMIWQQKLTPVNDEKQRVIMFFMSIVMTAVFINLPAGLVLYWFMNNILTIGEDYVRKYFYP